MSNHWRNKMKKKSTKEKPCPPRKPDAPVEYYNRSYFTGCELDISGTNKLVNVIAGLNKVLEAVRTLPNVDEDSIMLEIAGERDSYWGRVDTTVRAVYKDPNPDYKKELQKYNRAMKLYEAQLVVYEKELADWELAQKNKLTTFVNDFTEAVKLGDPTKFDSPELVKKLQELKDLIKK